MWGVVWASAAWAAPSRQAVDLVLDGLHAAATKGDFDDYFQRFHPDAIFVGTDPTEVWTLAEFQAFASPHFAEPPAWSYVPRERRVDFDRRGRTAWFYEVLRHARYGDVRGSGVLVLEEGQWRIRQYVLSFALPNEVTTLPPPFTAAQIREAYVPGLTLTNLVRAEGQTTRSRSLVVSADETSVLMRDLESGAEYGATWEQLRDHASFPAGATRWSEEVLVTPWGTLPCRRYDVHLNGVQRSFWFAQSFPGQPVKVTGPDYELTLIAREGP